MRTTDEAVRQVAATIEKHRAGHSDEVGAALAVVALSSDRVDREVAARDDMIRVAHQVGASLRHISEVSGLNRKTVTAIVEKPVG